MAMAVALFAITLNFLQPLAHAALLRDGAPGALWTMFCNSSAGGEAHKGSTPATAASHDCCLGLAHATAFVEPSSAFALVRPVAAVAARLPPAEQPASVGIRDGPHRPRGPPTLA